MSLVFIQTDQAATDIKTYNMVQTGPKTQLGGLKLGKTISEYQGSLKEAVVKPPIAEAANVIKRMKIKDKYLFLVIK